MTDKKTYEKYNDSCVKIFQLLELLTKGEADYKDVIKLFSDEFSDGKSNPHVVLNKYLNTLKVFGIKVKKDKNKYYLMNTPYKIDFNVNDLKAIGLLKETVNFLPAGKNRTNFSDFLKSLEIRYSDNSQNLSQKISTNHHIDLSFYFSEFSEQIKQCEKFCQEKFKLELTYSDKLCSDKHIICSPIELKYFKRKICLCVYGHTGNQIIEIPVENIKSAVQLPAAATSKIMATTIVYKLKNKLAKNYKLREWERSDGKDENGSLIVINRNEDFDVLLRRLMRYGSECVIISPKFIRERMIDLINKTLSNYDD